MRIARVVAVVALLVLRGGGARADSQPPAAAPAAAPAAPPAAGDAARATEPSAINKEVAKAAFKNAERLFQRGRYVDAEVEYKAAYKLWALPGFLFNIAQCERNLGHTAEAIDHFERYLRSPKADRNRSDVEAVLADLRRQRAAELAPPTVLTGTPSRSPATAATAATSIGAARPPPRATPHPPPPATTPATSPAGGARRSPPGAGPAAPPSHKLRASRGAPPTASAIVTTPAPAPPAPEGSPPLPSPPAESSSPEPREASRPPAPRPVYRRPWFWVATGAATVVVAGAIAIGAGAASSTPAASLGSADWR